MPYGNNGNGNGGQKKKKNGNGKGKKNGNGRRNGNSMQRVRVVSNIANSTENTRPMVQGVSRQKGSDFWGKVTVKAAFASAADRIIASFPISPSAYLGTRLTQIADLWERYKFIAFKVRYVPAVPNTMACQFILYIDTDPSDDATLITDADHLIRQAVAQAGAQQWNFNKPKVTNLALRADNQYLYTGVTKENVRFTHQGHAYLIQATQCLDFNGKPITADLEAGSIFIDWDVNFQIAQINPAPIVARQIPDVPVFELYEREFKFRDYPQSITITADNPGTAGQLSVRGKTFEIAGTSVNGGYAGMDLGTKRLAIISFGSGGTYEMNSLDTVIVPGVYGISFATSQPNLYPTSDQVLKFTAAFPFTVTTTRSLPAAPAASAPAPPRPPFSVDLDNLRRMLAECMTESNVPIGNALEHNPADDIHDRLPTYDVEANTYPAWDDEGLLDDDDPEYDAKFARRNFAQELYNDPSYEPIGAPIVITAQTIDINTNVRISDETRSKIDTAVRVVMAGAPELSPYSLVVPFVRDELESEYRLNTDSDSEDL